MITGPHAGKVQNYGPVYGPNAVSSPITGANTQLWSTFVSSGYNPIESNDYLVYATIMVKDPVDPDWWIGDATEVGGAATPTATPSATSTATASPTVTPGATPTATAPPTTSPTATATATATPTAGAPDIQCEMDFEDVGCEDGGSTDSCTPASDYNDDCVAVTKVGRRGVTVNVNCPVEGGGTKSGWTVGLDTGSAMEMLTDCSDGSVKTVDFKAKMVCGGIAASAEIFGLQATTGSSAFGMVWNQATQLVKFWCGATNRVNNPSWVGGLFCGTDYNVRFNFESDGTGTECTYYFDETSSNDWGVGAALNNDGSALASTDTNLSIDGFFHTETEDAIDSVIDDIGDCDATVSFVASGVKCGSEGPTSTPTATPTAVPSVTATPTTSPTATPTQEPPENPGCRRGRC